MRFQPLSAHITSPPQPERDSPTLPKTIRDQPSTDPPQSRSFDSCICVMSLGQGFDLARVSITEQDLGIPEMRRGQADLVGNEERLNGVVQRVQEGQGCRRAASSSVFAGQEELVGLSPHRVHSISDRGNA